MSTLKASDLARAPSEEILTRRAQESSKTEFLTLELAKMETAVSALSTERAVLESEIAGLLVREKELLQLVDSERQAKSASVAKHQRDVEELQARFEDVTAVLGKEKACNATIVEERIKVQSELQALREEHRNLKDAWEAKLLEQMRDWDALKEQLRLAKEERLGTENELERLKQTLVEAETATVELEAQLRDSKCLFEQQIQQAKQDAIAAQLVLEKERSLFAEQLCVREAEWQRSVMPAREQLAQTADRCRVLEMDFADAKDKIGRLSARVEELEAEKKIIQRRAADMVCRPLRGVSLLLY